MKSWIESTKHFPVLTVYCPLGSNLIPHFMPKPNRHKGEIQHVLIWMNSETRFWWGFSNLLCINFKYKCVSVYAVYVCTRMCGVCIVWVGVGVGAVCVWCIVCALWLCVLFLCGVCVYFKFVWSVCPCSVVCVWCISCLFGVYVGVYVCGCVVSGCGCALS